MRIISNRDKDGKFVGAADAWTEEEIEALMKKYNPAGKLWYSSENQANQADQASQAAGEKMKEIAK